jgi:tripartite-type tricarboxylate transporter receptor subunit TctC
MISLPKRNTLTAALALAVLGLSALAPLGNVAHAVYPDKPIKIVIPFAPGGPSDVLGRAIAQKLNIALGQPVIADNKPGAGTNLAAEFVAKSPADGYTLLLMMVGTQAINEAMYPKLAYNTVRDFAPISLTAASSLILAAHPSVPAKNLKELVTLVKANPAKFNYGTAGAGTPLHLGGLLFNNLAGTDFQRPLQRRSACDERCAGRADPAYFGRHALGAGAYQIRQTQRHGRDQPQALGQRTRGAHHCRELPWL